MDTSKATLSATGIATAVIPWIVTLVLALLFTFDGLGRFVVQRPLPFEAVEFALRIAGGLLIVAICIGVIRPSRIGPRIKSRISPAAPPQAR